MLDYVLNVFKFTHWIIFLNTRYIKENNSSHILIVYDRNGEQWIWMNDWNYGLWYVMRHPCPNFSPLQLGTDE